MPSSGADAGAPPMRSPSLWPLAIVGAVLVANLPGIVGITDVNPLATYAGLTRSRAPQLVPGVATIDINVGATSQALGHRAALDWLSGHVPWWNPYEGVGFPLAAGMQAAAFFPFTLLLAWSDGQLAERLLLESIAGISTYLLLRRLGVRQGVAGAGGIVFGLCGTFAWFQHAAINPVPFLPAALLGVEVARERPLGDWRSLLLPLALALSIVAGFPETAFFDDALVVLWALWRSASESTWGERGRLAGRLALLGAGGVLLTSPLVLAFRSYLGVASIGAHTGMAHVHLQPSNLLTLIDPYVTGPLKAFVGHAPAAAANLFITNSGYVLVSGFALALAGLACSRRDLGIRLLLVVWVALISLRDFGAAPVEHLFAHIPYVRESAVFRSAVPSIELAFVLLACFGIEAVLDAGGAQSRARRWHLPALALATGALVAGLAAGPSRELLHLVWSGGPYGTNPRPYVVGAAVATAVILAGLAVSGALRGRLAAAGLCGIFVLEAAGSFFYPELAATRHPVVDSGPVAWLATHVGSARAYSLTSDPAVAGAYGGPIAPNYGSYFDIAMVDYLDIPVPERYVGYVHDHLDPYAGAEFFGTLIGRAPGAPSALTELGKHVAGFEAIGVRYIVTGSLIPLGSYVPSARRVYADGLVAIWRLPRAGAYFSVVRGSCRLHALGVTSVEASCASAAAIQRAELFLPGWSASVNGRPARLVRSGDGLFSSVGLPAGRSTVVWSYRPGDLTLGETLALAGVLLLALPFCWRAVARRRRRQWRSS